VKLRALAAILSFVAIASSMLSSCARSPYGNFSNVPDRKSCVLDVSLPNMACSEACPIKVQNALGSVAGVRRVEVDYDSRSATVDANYPACSSGGFEQMMKNLYMQGYKARIVSSREPMGWE